MCPATRSRAFPAGFRAGREIDALEHVQRRLPVASEPLIQNALEGLEERGAIIALGCRDETAADG